MTRELILKSYFKSKYNGTWIKKLIGKGACTVYRGYSDLPKAVQKIFAPDGKTWRQKEYLARHGKF